jgi:hypothetical protein
LATIKADASSGHSTTKAQTERLMRRIEERDVTGVLPQPVWQETIHRSMIMAGIENEIERVLQAMLLSLLRT